MTRVLPFTEFAELYCKSQENTPAQLFETLQQLRARYNPVGFVLLRCIVLDSSRLGERVIVPYGPNNTWKEIPDRPVSPRGLCSDISEVEAVCLAESL